MVAFGVAAAFAGAGVAPTVGGEAPWIEVHEAHVGHEAHCEAAVTLAQNGRVVTVLATGCEEPWKTATESEVAGWRFPKGTPDQVLLVDYPAPTVIRRDDMQAISLDEATPIFTPWRQIGDKLNMSARGAHERTRCDVEFFVDGNGLTYALDLSHCPERARILAEHRLMRYRFEPESIAGRGLVPVRFRTHVVIR
jgi:hypothetical protein